MLAALLLGALLLLDAPRTFVVDARLAADYHLQVGDTVVVAMAKRSTRSP